MSSHKPGETPSICDLISLTEGNLKRIEAVSGRFITPVLNEWRYATWHVAQLISAPDDAEHRRKAESHLVRAYLDSCEILLVVLLDRCREFRERVGEYSDILRQYVKDYDEWLAKIRAAQEAHGAASECDRLARAKILAAHCDNLTAFLGVVDVCEDDLTTRIAKERRKDRRECIFLICSVIAAAGVVAQIISRCL